MDSSARWAGSCRWRGPCRPRREGRDERTHSDGHPSWNRASGWESRHNRGSTTDWRHRVHCPRVAHGQVLPSGEGAFGRQRDPTPRDGFLAPEAPGGIDTRSVDVLSSAVVTGRVYTRARSRTVRWRNLSSTSQVVRTRDTSTLVPDWRCVSRGSAEPCTDVAEYPLPTTEPLDRGWVPSYSWCSTSSQSERPESHRSLRVVPAARGASTLVGYGSPVSE